MEIWRKIQIANVILAVVAIALSVVAIYVPSVVYWAMWAWSFTLWIFMFLVPMPVIERNKKSNQLALALAFLFSVMLAVTVNTWLQTSCPATHGFSRGVLVYSVAYTIVALLFAAWLKIKEKKKNK